ncbi:MAG: hypothetical protein K1X83_06600 [Oligoflexia bacterium]|nr:hypothetical protein [Oligoflexia bacterium]
MLSGSSSDSIASDKAMASNIISARNCSGDLAADFSSGLRRFASVLLIGVTLAPAAGCSSNAVKGSNFPVRPGREELSKCEFGQRVSAAQFDTCYYAEKLEQIAAIRDGEVYTINPDDSTVTSPMGFKSIAPLETDPYRFVHPHTKKLYGITLKGSEVVFDVPIKRRD